MLKKLYHGTAFYPELWSAEVVSNDISWMEEIGINVVRIGEFLWSTVEPQEGHIELGLLVQVIGQLHEAGIETIMCTPTATPPVWYSHGHPERLFVNTEGTRLGHGSRQHACTNHPYFREKASIITDRLAQELGQLPGLIAWQLDNEFKAHVSACMCDVCRDLWHEWLEQRYGQVEHLNECWGTRVWSQSYQDFRQVPQPGPTPFLHNSSLQTMYQLFSMEKIAEFAEEQAAIIRRSSPVPVTHNSSMAFHVDNERLFRSLDFASYDTYASAAHYSAYMLNCDLFRNFKPDHPFWIMETSPSHAGSIAGSGTPHPNGYLAAEAVAAYASGAEGFCYWLWRQQRSGCEQPHGSIVSAWGKPGIGYENVLEAEAARKSIESAILNSRPVRAEAAITYSDRAKAFLTTESHGKLRHRGLVSLVYDVMLQTGMHRDLIPEGASMAGYKLLWTPFVPHLSSDYMNQALAFVDNGGIWIVGPMTAVRTEEHTVPTNAGLGDLEKFTGAETIFTYDMDGTGTLGEAFGVTAPLSLWSTVFKPVEAVSMGTLLGGPSPGMSFLTEYRRGLGKLVLLGSMPAEEEGSEMLEQILIHYGQEANVKRLLPFTQGTIVIPRKSHHEDLWVIINMNGQGGSVTLPMNGTDKLTGVSISAGNLVVKPYEYRLIALPAGV
ncbi:beta-galactosidase [Paenibacillus lemnae]|uniref:Beta-galactosidase n=1 Tax=Paenibacillus lemnae TaxID=1330551 RepID=A0A848M7D4_PAELE|nr:beta-galactosidase [Paenibacillus lemnae]NMO96546.1 beta-galactosidase [Paenibacillus lemnae]